MSGSVNKAQMSNPVHLLAFGFGSGLAPKAPGTAGTVAAIVPYLLFQQLSLPLYLLLVLASFVLGVYVCGKTADDMGVHDHGGIVWDEFVGLWITMIAAPPGFLWLLAGFALFRLFDIWKPWPISELDKKVVGGLGIMVDDVVAGLFALIILQLSAYFLLY